MRIRARHGVVAGMLAFVTVLYSGALSGDPSSPDANGCASVVAVKYIDGSGKTVSAPGPGIGQIRYYGAPYEGASTVISPGDFVPTAASDRELAVFGYPPRPKSGDGKAIWEKTWGRSRFVDPGVMCSTGRHN